MILWGILIGIPLLLGLYAQHKVSSTYNKFIRVPSSRGITGREAAAYVLQSAGINDVEIVQCRGHLTDHYDPAHKRLALSQQNYGGSSLAAIGVAAHEAGHAIQHATGYNMLQARMALVPITSLASQFLPFVIIGGIFFQIFELITLGAIIYGILTVFQLITLPVEFDATSRAKSVLGDLGIVTGQESVGVAKTLDAAALTYVAAFVASLGNFLYLLMLARGNE